MTPERVVGIGFVAVLHAIVLWAIVTGLVQRYVKPPPEGTVHFYPQKPEEHPPVKPVIPNVKLPEDHRIVAPPPVVIDDGAPPTPLAPDPLRPFQPEQHTPMPPDTAAIGITSTHTIPPYPDLDRRLGNQGTVELRLTISPQGAVVAADVVRSSGFPRLDEAAQSWVLQHWRYKPAVKSGDPVASTTIAAVVFSIRNAG